MKKIFLTIALMLLLTAAQASAFSYTYYDFGQDNIFDYNNNYAPISYPNGIGNLPSPGYYADGGEFFDLEALNVAADNDYLYVSITNSFGFEQEGFRMGDLFIGVGNDKYAYAVDLQAGGANGGLYDVTNWNYIQQDYGSYYNYTSIRNAAGAHEMRSGTLLGGVSSMMTFEEDLETNPMKPWRSNGDTYVWELRIDRALINGGDFSNLSFHVNVGCGNDLMETKMTAPPSSVPEPATMLLFGLGLLGGAIQRRKNS